jgi:hypothetical protein
MKFPGSLRVVASAAALLCLSPLSALAQGDAYNTPGNLIIADQFNNRIVELNPADGKIVWTFGTGSTKPGPHSVVAPNDVQRIGDLTLIAGTGAPSGTPVQYEPNCLQNACPDNRVMVVNQAGVILWQYGIAGVTGFGKNQLNTPVQATFLPNDHVLITDQGNARVIEVDRKHNIVWQYGKTNNPGSGTNQLNNPNSAELLENGDILIADESNNRVLEVNRQRQIVWQYAPNDTTKLNGAAFASRLCNGHTLITDSGNNRILDVDSGGNAVVFFVTNTRSGSIANPLPTRAIRMCNGNTIISDQYNNQVIEVNAKGKVVFSYGQIGVVGSGAGQLNAPYDAKEVGDYVGITPPFGVFFAPETAN